MAEQTYHLKGQKSFIFRAVAPSLHHLDPPRIPCPNSNSKPLGLPNTPIFTLKDEIILTFEHERPRSIGKHMLEHTCSMQIFLLIFGASNAFYVSDICRISMEKPLYLKRLKGEWMMKNRKKKGQTETETEERGVFHMR